MRHLLVLVFCTLFAMACGSVPQTREEFEVVAKKDFEQIPFQVDGISFAQAKKRMLSYADKCLSFEKTTEGFNQGGGYSVDRMSSNPTFEDGTDVATLYQQQDQNGTKLQKVPEGGWYVGMIQLSKVKDHTNGVAYYYKSMFAPHLKKIAEYGIDWIAHDHQLCPKF